MLAFDLNFCNMYIFLDINELHGIELVLCGSLS